MSWGKKQEKKASIFYQGKNIIEILKNSLFGKIKNIIVGLVGNNKAELEAYRLPRVVVIGNESTGKSSLLENITKCQLFPRHNLLCTKAPIHLILNNGNPKYTVRYSNPELDIDIDLVVPDKAMIYEHVDKIMRDLTDTISEYEIIIEIIDDDMPTFEFFDLPGIRTYPPNLAEITTNLCKKYLEDQDSIVMCVVPATVTRLTSCQSVALIKEMKMEENCILALTMPDRLRCDDVEELLVKRIMMTSDEFSDVKFSSCIAVINRSHNDTVTLTDSNSYENEWFQKNIIDIMPTDYVEQKTKIISALSIDNLLIQMDILYNKYIHSNWKPRISAKLERDIANLVTQIQELGKASYKRDEMVAMFKEFVRAHLSKYMDCDTYAVDHEPTRNDPLNVELYSQIRNKINAIECSVLLSGVDDMFLVDYDKSAKLYRFDDAREFIQKIINEYFQDNRLILNQIHSSCKAELDSLFMKSYDLIEEDFVNYVKILITVRIIVPLLAQPTPLLVSLFEKYPLEEFTESKKYTGERSGLIDRLRILRNYANNIDKI